MTTIIIVLVPIIVFAPLVLFSVPRNCVDFYANYELFAGSGRQGKTAELVPCPTRGRDPVFLLKASTGTLAHGTNSYTPVFPSSDSYCSGNFGITPWWLRC